MHPRSVLDSFIGLFAVIVLLSCLTGGLIVQMGHSKVDFAEVSVWAMALSLLTLLRIRVFSAKGFWFWKKLLNLIQWVQDPKRSRTVAIWMLGGVFGLLFIAHVFRHIGLFTDGYDVGFVHQSLFWPFGSAGSSILKCDLCVSGTYLGEHLSYTFLLFSPILSWLHSDFLIFFVQAFVLILPIWWALKEGPLAHQKRWWGLLAFLIVCQVGLRSAALWDFREDHLAFAFLLGACMSLYRGKEMATMIFLVLAILSKENVAFVTLFFAIPILKEPTIAMNRFQRRRIFIFTILFSLAWIFVSFRWLIPHYNSGTEGSNNIVHRFSGLGTTPREILVHILTSPAIWWKLLHEQILTPLTIKYLLLLFGPFLFFFLPLSRLSYWLVPAVPGILMNVLSQSPLQRSLQFHYDLIIMPFIIFAFLISASKLSKTLKTEHWAVAILVALAFSGRWPGHQITRFWPRWNDIHSSAYLHQVPDQGITATNLTAMAQMARFRDLRLIRFQDGELSLKNFWKWNSTLDRTHILGHNATSAQYLLLDKKNEREFWLNARLAQQWQEVSESSDGRFVYLKKKGH